MAAGTADSPPPPVCSFPPFPSHCPSPHQKAPKHTSSSSVWRATEPASNTPLVWEDFTLNQIAVRFRKVLHGPPAPMAARGPDAGVPGAARLPGAGVVRAARRADRHVADAGRPPRWTARAAPHSVPQPVWLCSRRLPFSVGCGRRQPWGQVYMCARGREDARGEEHLMDQLLRVPPHPNVISALLCC